MHLKTFKKQRDPIKGTRWTELTPEYADRKSDKYGAKRILEATGDLRRAASTKGARGQVLIPKRLSMIFGVDLRQVYPNVHQLTVRKRKDGKPLRRGWFGIKGRDLALSIKFAIDEVVLKKFKRVRGARYRKG